MHFKLIFAFVEDDKTERVLKAARTAGFQIVCMSYGYNHGTDIREAAPDAVIDSLAELKGLLEQAA